MTNETVQASSINSMVFLLMKFAKHNDGEEETPLTRILFEELHSWFGALEKSSDPKLEEGIRSFIRSELIEGIYGSKDEFLSDLERLLNYFKEQGRDSVFYRIVVSVLDELYAIHTDNNLEVAEHVQCSKCSSVLYVRVDSETCPRCLTSGSLAYPAGGCEESGAVMVPLGTVIEWVYKDFLPVQ